MHSTLRSILLGTSGLWVADLAAALLTIRRTLLEKDMSGRERVTRLLLVGLAAQCLHFGEEYVTQFEVRFPRLLDLSPWPGNFFVIFNLGWLSVWILSAVGLQRGWRLSLFPVWFFAIASMVNGIGHPVLSILVRRYFPGLLTSPLVGVEGVLLWRRLWAATA
jgi:hypothetical protein